MARLGGIGGYYVGVGGLAGLGAALILKQQSARGAELLGAAARLKQKLEGDYSDGHEQQILDHAAETAKAALGEEAFAAAWARWDAIPPDEILTLALAE